MEHIKRKYTSRIKKDPSKKKARKNDGIKKPTSAYLYFVSDYRMVMKKKGKDISKVQEVAKLCGAAWKGMTNEEKSPYTVKYEADKARFLKEKEALDKRMGKDPSKPKRPQTGYFFFLAEFRKEMAGKTLEDGEKIPSLAGEKWRDMTPENRKKYEEMVEQDKIRYEKEMAEWRKKNPNMPKRTTTKKKLVGQQAESSSTSSSSSSDDDDSEDDSDNNKSNSDDSD